MGCAGSAALALVRRDAWARHAAVRIVRNMWVATAQAIYVAAFGYEAAAGIPDFARRVLTTPQGWWLIVVGCGVGFLFAVVALCISVVSFPLMLDRHAGAADAMVTSLRAVARNPVMMAA